MKLESARELKLELTEKLLAPMAVTARARALPRSAARSVAMENEAATPPTVALGVSVKGKLDFGLAVRVQQRALEGSREVELIRKQAKGEADIRYIGDVKKRAVPWYRQPQRPLRIGCSVGHFKVTAGTLGGFVRLRPNGALAILSNNHVLANENRARKGDAILQPGVYDGGKMPDAVAATLTDFVKFKKLGANSLDCACAEIEKGIDSDLTKLTGLGKLKGVSDIFVDEGLHVAKIGRTTGLTRGRVTAFELDNVTVEFDIGVLRFDGQIEIEGEGNTVFSDGGDSGSLIVGEDLRAVALLFAGSDQGGSNGKGLTYANPIRSVLDGLGVDLVIA